MRPCVVCGICSVVVFYFKVDCQLVIDEWLGETMAIVLGKTKKKLGGRVAVAFWGVSPSEKGGTEIVERLGGFLN